MEHTKSTILGQQFDDLFDKGDFKSLVYFIHNASVAQLTSEAWDILPKLCSNLSSSEDINAMCRNILQHLAVNCETKEMLSLLNVELQKCDDDVIFCGIVSILHHLFEKMPQPRSENYDTLFSSIYCYIKKLTIPTDMKLEGKEIGIYKLDKNYQRISIVISSIASMCNHVVSNEIISNQSCPNKLLLSEFQIIIKFMLNCFSSPLAFVNISLRTCYNCQAVSQCEASCIARNERFSKLQEAIILFVNIINKIQPDTPRLLSTLESFTDTSSNKTDFPNHPVHSAFGSSILVYLIYSEDLLSANCPAIYTHQYIFEIGTNYVITLLQSEQTELVGKALSLFCRLLSKLHAEIWNAEFLEWPQLKEVLKCIIYQATVTQLESQKEQCLRIIATIVKAFTPCVVRCRLLRMLLIKSPRKVVVGHIIALIKEEIDENIKILSNQASDTNVLNTKHSNTIATNVETNRVEELEMFEKLLSLIFSLPSGEQTDLLDHSERIVGALNLLKYLISIDEIEHDYSRIWTMLPHVEDKYIPILGRAIDLSRSQYLLEVNKNKDKLTRKKIEAKRNILEASKGNSTLKNDCNTVNNEISSIAPSTTSFNIDKSQNANISNENTPFVDKGTTGEEAMSITPDNQVKNVAKDEMLFLQKQLFLMQKSIETLNGLESLLGEAVDLIKKHKCV